MSYFKMEWIQQYLPDIIPTIFFDIGSYNGNDGRIFKNSYKNSRVISIEADQSLYNKMVENKNNSGLEMFNYAICDIDGEVDIFESIGSKRGISSIHPPSEKLINKTGVVFKEPKRIKSLTIKSLCGMLNVDHIDVLHMDIQGAEYEALIGMKDIRPNMIFLEINALQFYKNSKPTCELLTTLGYKNIPIDNVTTSDKLWIYYDYK